MNDREFLPPQAHRPTLKWALVAVWLAQLALLVWVALALRAQGWTWLGAASSVVLVWLLLQGLLLAFPYVLKWRLGDWSREIRGSLRQMLRTLSVEAGWMTRFYLIEHPWRGAPMQLQPADQRLPLLLVHGFLCNGAVWNPLAADLRAAGRSFASVSLEPSYRDFQQQLRDLDAAVSMWLAATGVSRLILIGHSMGGLLARAYADRDPQRCAAVICVAAPHHGTYLGDWFHGLEGGPPSPRCRWLQEYNARSQERIAVPALNLWSADDSIVLPAASAQLAATPEQALHGHGHMALVAAPAARALLMRTLGELESGLEGSS
ncbi:MAG: esterase/lipase family protein [Lysobacterales bacterium]